MTEEVKKYPDVLIANFISKSARTEKESFECHMYCLVEEDQTPQQVVDRLLKAELIGAACVDYIHVITREGNDFVDKKLDGTELFRKTLSAEELLEEAK